MRFPPEIAEELLRLKWWNYLIEDILSLPPSNIGSFVDALKCRIERGDIRNQVISSINCNDIVASAG